MTAREAMDWLEGELLGAQSSEPSAEARWMLRAVGGFPLIGALPDGARETLEGYLRQRRDGRPLQYVLGGWEFMGLPMRLREGVLIPRPETETLVELALIRARERKLKSALDLGAGSGCITVALAALGSFQSVTAVDYSAEALVLARENAVLNAVSPELLLGSWFAPVHGRKFDLIVSNPPYIESEAVQALPREVRYEPRLALDGGPDGLSAYRLIALSLSDYLEPDGAAFFEVGWSQAKRVCSMLEEQGFRTGVHLDLAGVERVVEAYRPKTNPGESYVNV